MATDNIHEKLDEATKKQLLDIPHHTTKNKIQSQFLLKFAQLLQQDVKRLQKDSGKNITRQCVFCKKLFAMTWKSRSFDSTKDM